MAVQRGAVLVLGRGGTWAGEARGFALGIKGGEIRGCHFEIHWPCVSLCQCVFLPLYWLSDRRQAKLFKLE